MAPTGLKSFATSMPVWLKEKLFLKKLLSDSLSELGPGIAWVEKLLFSEHHLSHAASAFYPSPFEEALVLTLDGVGEWTTSSVAIGRGRELAIRKEIHFPHSLGLLYSAFTYHAGFRVNSGEYKLMGLAPYGIPRFASRIFEHLVDVKSDGSFRLNLEYFDYCAGDRMTNSRFDELFESPPRGPESPLEQRHMDLAASIQAVTEEILLRLTRSLAREYQLPHLCLAGGVALNCVANGKLLRDGAFRKIWIQPAAGDAGGALGAALVSEHLFLGKPRTTRPKHPDSADKMAGSYLGPEFTDAEIADRLRAAVAVFESVSSEALLSRCAEELARGKALGWFQGRMEFGPRALGARSILADPRSQKMQSTLNLKVKYRE